MNLDKDLQAIQEVRLLVEAAHAAQAQLERLDQAAIDAIITAMAAAAEKEARRLADLAVEETGYGNSADKVLKNLFVARNVAAYIRPLRTMGIIREDPGDKIAEIAVPMGVVAAIIPSTNPTSTAIFKCLISLKAGNGVVLSPHPAASRCIVAAAEVCREAAVKAGAPEGIIGCLTNPTLEATQELMRHRKVAIILATGGAGLVRAAYGSGKPAYGVGPGNVPAYIDRSADVPKAVKDILTGKTFDNGTLCSSEQSAVVDAPVEAAVIEEMQRLGACILDSEQSRKLEAVAIQANRSLNPAVVGKSALQIADMAGISVPAGTRALVVRLSGVGRDHPLSCEKLSPILALYRVEGWREGCVRCKEILAYGGMGHTLAIHCKDPEIVRRFGLEKPAFRICVNTPSTHGSIGLSTGLAPSLTLGCGTYGNNITTDNITPMHLVQVKRLAWETSEAFPSWFAEVEPMARGAGKSEVSTSVAVPKADTVAAIVEAYLAARKKPADAAPASEKPEVSEQTVPARVERPNIVPSPPPVEFVCELDVRMAIQSQRKIPVDSRTIITPAARDLGAEHGVFDHT